MGVAGKGCVDKERNYCKEKDSGKMAGGRAKQSFCNEEKESYRI